MQAEAEKLGLLGDDSASALSQRIAKAEARSKQIERSNAGLADKLATFVGHEGNPTPYILNPKPDWRDHINNKRPTKK